MGVEVVGMVGEMNKGIGGSVKESVVGLVGSVGVQIFVFKVGCKVCEKIEVNLCVNKVVKDFEYNVCNVFQVLFKYVNIDKYDDGFVICVFKGVFCVGMGSLFLDMCM